MEISKIRQKTPKITHAPLPRPRSLGSQQRLPRKSLLTGALLLLAIVITFSSSASWYLTSSRPKSALLSQQPIIPAPPLSVGDTAAISSFAQRYMHEFLSNNYPAMWSMLHPDIQKTWPGEKSYTSYLQKRFQDYALKNYILGRISSLSSWVNPETMVRYQNVQMLLISLQIALKKTPPKLASPEILHPENLYRNLPFIVQRISQHGGQPLWTVLCAGPADPESPILPPLHPLNQTALVPILMYHHITDVPTHNVLDQSLTVTPQVFSAQLNYLKVRGYHSITFNQLFNNLYFDAPLPIRPVILTFDDGYDDAYKFAYPILQQHGYSGMFYIITGKVGWNGQASWQQLRAMLANGMQMGSHTVHHVDIGAVYLSSLSEAQQELQFSQITLQKNLGIPIQQFCYPSGEPFKNGSIALREAIVSLLAADGYVGATTDPGMTGIAQNSLDPLALLRIRVDGRESLTAFERDMPW